MHLGALSQRGLCRRRGAGDRRQAQGRREPGRHPHGEARRHRGLARDRLGRAAGGADRARPALARRAETVCRPGDPARRQGRHEDAAADGAHGLRSEHGRALSVLAARQAQGDHRAVRVLRAGTRSGKQMGTRDHPVRDAERAVPVFLAAGPAADQGPGGRAVRRPGDPAPCRPAVRRRELRSRARSGRAQRQPPDRERVGAHHGL